MYQHSSSSQAQPLGTYTLQQFASLSAASNHATFNHLVSAADHVAQILQASSIPYSLMGGFSLALRGSSRSTHDVDITVSCNMLQLKQALSSQPRILRPAGPASGVMRIFVKTGGQFDDRIPELAVMVDLILGGSLSAPENPQEVSNTISTETYDGRKEFTVLDIVTIMKSKLASFSARGGLNDFQDIFFLITNFSENIFEARGELDQRHCKAFIDACTMQYTGPGSESRIKDAKTILGVD